MRWEEMSYKRQRFYHAKKRRHSQTRERERRRQLHVHRMLQMSVGAAVLVGLVLIGQGLAAHWL